jgi:paraquat-inducible protein B
VSDTGELLTPTRAVTRRSRHVPVIWAIPLLAIAIGGWLAWDTLSKRGPTITISFVSAEGLQAGQSQLKFKDIVLGTVQSLTLTPDHTRVLVKIATTRQAEPLLTEQTIFWVVKPRLFAGNVSGLDTLVSGSYVGMLPAQTGGKQQLEFTGREDPPVLEANVPGTTFLLKASRIGSISLGSPVYYRDIAVGEVLGWDIGDMAASVTIRAFVREPFDKYVRDDSRFWNASGVSVKLGAGGVELQLESLRAILLGGIAFDTPTEEVRTASSSVAGHEFPLFQDRDTARAASYSRKIPVVSYFAGSVRGLEAGSEVTMHGLVVGHVTSVQLVYDAAKDAIVAPVHFEVEPERILGVGAKSVFKTPAEAANAVVKRGMRASLQSASLITGQQMVALDFVHDAPPAEVTMDGPDFVLPTTEGGGFAGLQASASALLDKVNTIPFKQIGDNLDGILRSTNNVASGPEIKKALTDLSSTISDVKDLVAQLDSGMSPALQQLPGIASGLQKTMTSVNKLSLSLENGYGNNTQFNRDLERLLVQVNDALRSIRSLADLLARHPEALIKGRPAGGVE